MRELLKKQNATPLVLLSLLFLLREFGGRGPVLNYTVYMFRKAGVQLDAFFCAVLVGVARLASTCISACMLDLVGRKTFLVAAALMCAVSEGVAGIFLFLEVEKATWVPLASVIVFVIGYGLGLGSIPGVYVGELLPTPVRSLGSAIIIFICYLAHFAVNLVFLKMTSFLGLGLTLLVFGGANLAIVPFVLLCIPETKGRALQDTERAFVLREAQEGQDNSAFEMDAMPSKAKEH